MSRLCKIRGLCFLLCSLAFVLPLQQAAASKIHRVPRKQYREQIADLEEEWRKATLAADVPTIDRMLSDDYVGISWNGQVNTKASQLERLRNRSLMLTRLDLSDLKIKVLGSVAIVTSRADIEGVNDGVEMKGSFVYTRIYKRLPSGTWKITNFEATRLPPPGEHSRKPHPFEPETK